jgi:uncharacterized protein YndB with AHSA1/START domain
MTPEARPHAAAQALTVRWTFDHPRTDVFAAWTNPDALATWFGGALAKTLSAAVDLRVGGAYRLTFQAGSDVIALEGVYREVEVPERLVYTWRWDGLDIDGGRESLVTVEFREHDGATELVLIHEGIEADRSLVFHESGWDASMRELQQVLKANDGR